MILFLERLKPEVGAWLEIGCFQTSPLEGKAASQLGYPQIGQRKARTSVENMYAYSGQAGGEMSKRRPDGK